MQYLDFAPDQTPDIASIPELQANEFHQAMLDSSLQCQRLLAYFGVPSDNGARLYAIFDNSGIFRALRSEALRQFDSIARDYPQAQLFEREIYENFGIEPKHHPWLKPVRVTPDAIGRSGNADYGFYRVQGGQSHEVAVGPIHAGIIEPGHFRFQCYGEKVMNLEIALGYQHRGLDKIPPQFPDNPNHKHLRIVECMAGDESVAYATAFCLAYEKLVCWALAPQSQRMRRIGLELERLACHCGDLGAIAGDTGFLPTSSWNGRIRGDFLNLTAYICGNRFGREYIKPGGVCRYPNADECGILLERLEAAARDAIGSSEIMFSSTSVFDRMSGTGALTEEQGRELGLVGVAARACGIACDCRYHYPIANLPLYGCAERLEKCGDVLARAKVRMQELRDSFVLVKNDLLWLAKNQGLAETKPGALSTPANKLVVALVESWRGSICHVAITDDYGKLAACKFVDPSFHNWAGLALAMRDGQISDFPLCNKSFNLSYCGYDQ